ncbi:MAG: hypothetical protein QXL01_01535 [Thermoplasmatales archaeon]
MNIFDDRDSSEGTICKDFAVSSPSTKKSVFPMRKSWDEVKVGDYVLCTEDVPVFDGSGGNICDRGRIYRVLSISYAGIELHHRPHCIITRAMFEKCHLQVVK